MERGMSGDEIIQECRGTRIVYSEKEKKDRVNLGETKKKKKKEFTSV